MQTRSQNPPLQYELHIDRLIRKLRVEIREKKEREMADNCGSKAFQVYFDDAKDSSQESRVKQVSRIRESFNKESRFK